MAASFEEYEHVPEAIQESVRLLAQAADAHGDYFPGHSHGVAYIVRLMAAEAGMGPDEVSKLELAAMMHDAGKLLVPASVLAKITPLTDLDMHLIQEHPTNSARLAHAIGGSAKEIAPWIAHHHERMDGTGYPDKLIGDKIPLASRMLFVADAFHVMTSQRPYSRSCSRTEALAELRRCAGTQFDLDCVEMLSDSTPKPKLL